MPANLLADKIISEIQNEIGTKGEKYDSSSPMKANKAIAKAITDYLKQNTMVAISYVGIIPGVPPIPDPLVSDMFKVTGNCSPASATNFDAWLSQLSLNIQTGFQLESKGTVGLMCGAPTLCFMGVTPFIGSQMILGLKGLHQANLDDPTKLIWTTISNVIWTWLNSMVVPTPFLCNNPMTGSTGTGMITKITVI